MKYLLSKSDSQTKSLRTQHATFPPLGSTNPLTPRLLRHSSKLAGSSQVVLMSRSEDVCFAIATLPGFLQCQKTCSSLYTFPTLFIGYSTSPVVFSWSFGDVLYCSCLFSSGFSLGCFRYFAYRFTVSFLWVGSLGY